MLDKMPRKERRNLVGKHFGRLDVIEFVRARRGDSYWRCKCSCGNTTEVLGVSLVHGRIKSCGCLSREVTVLTHTKHGQTKGRKRTPTYNSWQNMKNRCLNENYRDFYLYGGRGIKICDRWLNSFENFLEDMGERPAGTSLDREDSEGGYEPENCRWSTPKEQSNNMRINKVFEYNGKTATLSQWSEILGISRGTLNNRIKILHWDKERVFSTPAKKYNRKTDKRKDFNIEEIG